MEVQLVAVAVLGAPAAVSLEVVVVVNILVEVVVVVAAVGFDALGVQPIVGGQKLHLVLQIRNPWYKVNDFGEKMIRFPLLDISLPKVEKPPSPCSCRSLTTDRKIYGRKYQS